jgi:uncharacterized protein (DUF362 family)
MNRRQFVSCAGAAGAALWVGAHGGRAMASGKTPVALVHTEDRTQGVRASLKALDVNPVKGKDVLIKPNFNTADQTPGSTHNETLVALVKELWGMGARSIQLGERSFPPTRDVMDQKGVLPLMEDLSVQVVDFDRLEAGDWMEFRPKDTHWSSGFRIARPILEAECLVSTCCLKTHQYGGVFTMSLKLHVGVVPTSRHGYEYMRELHRSPHQRKLIAEINAPFKPALVVLDGVEAFVDGGPATGRLAQAKVFLASTDRVAMDAVGVAILKSLGSSAQIMNRKIFEQEQIARAVDLGIGVRSPSEIAIVAGDEASLDRRAQIAAILNEG